MGGGVARWRHVIINSLMGTLNPHSNGPLYMYSSTVIRTLAVDGWAVRGLGGAAARPGPSSLYQM